MAPDCAEIRCHETDTDINAAAELLRTGSGSITGTSEGRTRIVRIADILYFESVDKTCFFYTAEGVFRAEFRLYEAENNMKDRHFIRVSKSMVLNIMKIDEISPFISGRLKLRLSNGEYVIVSRQYSKALKQELGI